MTDEQPPPSPGLWTRFKNWVRGGPPAAPAARPAPATVTVRRPSTTPLVVPAEGGSFSFAVHSELIYTSTVLTKSKLLARVDEELYESDVATLMKAVWPIGRRFVPHRPDLAEQEMNLALAGRRDKWCHDDGAIRCSATVRVLADDRVLAHQLPYWESRIDQDGHLERELRRVEHVRTLMVRWVQLLEDFGDTPVAMQAGALTDTAVGEAVVGLAARRRTTEKELTDVLREARDAHAFVGLYELADTYDAAVRRFENRVGLRRSVLDSPVFDIHPNDRDANGGAR